MRGALLLLLLGAFVGPAAATARPVEQGNELLVPQGPRTPYLERIAPEEFLAIEHLLGETDSDSADLVIYLIEQKHLVRRWQLRPVGGGGKELYHAEGEVSHQTRLSAELADAVRTSFELALAKHVFPISNDVIARFQEGKLGARAYLVYLKKSPRQIAAGLVETDSCVTGLTDVIPFLDAVFALYQCCDQKGSPEEAEESLKAALTRLRLVSLKNSVSGG